ncbi:hypothetical protein [Methylobacillus glycogenes]|uniref:hypothetical protein n=1 Tax=Methylobacillus glycogenes TaxID=406 RepID=UPI000470922C|nr:hypothetical protein [Methylobacillus glycogenes]
MDIKTFDSFDNFNKTVIDLIQSNVTHQSIYSLAQALEKIFKSYKQFFLDADFIVDEAPIDSKLKAAASQVGLMNYDPRTQHPLIPSPERTKKLEELYQIFLIEVYPYIEYVALWNVEKKDIQETIDLIDSWFDHPDIAENSKNIFKHIKQFNRSVIISNYLNRVYAESNNQAEVLTSAKTEITQSLILFHKGKADLDALTLRVDALKQELSFAGLVVTFNSFIDRKRKSLKLTRVWVFVLGILLLTPVLVDGYFIWQTLSSDNSDGKMGLIYASIPLFISLSLFILYFFRINLQQSKNLQSQILQLELRSSLGSFIQDYMRFVIDNPQANKSALEKFDNIIFSNLIHNEDKIPSTFDGIEKIASFINAVKAQGRN